MIIHIRVPYFWIVVEEQRRPDLSERPIVIGSSFLEKTGAHARVLMANVQAESYGVRPGISIAHARHLCSEAVILSPDMPLYAAVWDGVMALLLNYTPLVESLEPGQAVCDVTGCERLFSDPVYLAKEIAEQIESTARLPAFAGVGSNRLTAQLAADSAISSYDRPRGKAHLQILSPDSLARVLYVEPGQEMAFLAPFPVTALPEIDPETLLAFQVLGLKTVEHLTRISESAFAKRFGPLGRRLAQYSRGRDDRPVRTASEAPTVSVNRRCDDDLVDGLAPDQALVRLVEHVAGELSDSLKAKGLVGRLMTLVFRAPISRSCTVVATISSALRTQSDSPVPRSSTVTSDQQDQFFPNQESRIHSMLPQPAQPGSNRFSAPTVRRPIENDIGEPVAENIEPGTTVLAMARMAATRPVNDQRTLAELARRLLLRVLSDRTADSVIAEPGIELRLEMGHFAPPEQMTLPGLDSRPADARLDRLHRQENILVSRFGATPFRYLAAVDANSVLSERVFRWGDGMRR